VSGTRIHKKPIGESGPVRVTHSGGQTQIDWQKIEYPPEKKEQELALAMSFVAALNAQQNSDWKLVRLDEDNFDFQLETGDEKRYLELPEIVIPGKKRGLPYASGEQAIHSIREDVSCRNYQQGDSDIRQHFLSHSIYSSILLIGDFYQMR
jgi:hypothetical protein